MMRMPITVYFATSNKHKFREAAEILSNYGINLKHFYFRHSEIRSDSIVKIAIEAVDAAYAKLKKPVFVEDTGLFIESLKGFPGTYSRWVLERIGCEGLLQLMKNNKNRYAEFRACISFKNGRTAKTFLGTCKGMIAEKKQGKSGFGYDSVFFPKGKKRTFAEDTDVKKSLSHRKVALTKLASFLCSRNI